MPTAADTTTEPAVARTPLTCVLVEDQGMFLDMLAGMLALRGGIRIIAQARDVIGGLQACTAHRPDLLILDLTLPDGDGLEVARQYVKTTHRGRVLVVTGQASEFVCPAWLNDHLQAVISKNDAFESLRRELDELTESGEPAADDSGLKSLSPREAEIFGLIGDGLTSRAIAERLGISEHTVQTYRKRIAAKLETTGVDVHRRAIAHRTAFFPRAPR